MFLYVFKFLCKRSPRSRILPRRYVLFHIFNVYRSYIVYKLLYYYILITIYFLSYTFSALVAVERRARLLRLCVRFHVLDVH